LSDIFLNGDDNIRFAGNINVSVKGVEASDLMAGLEGITVSSGSACNSSCAEPSYVLMALGYGIERAQCSIRIGIGKYTTDEEIEMVGNKFIHTVHLLRAKLKK
jgi:cysteine desulfurase